MEQKLNDLFNTHLSNFKLNEIKPIRQYYDPTRNGITFIPSPTVDAFTLNPSVSGKLKTHEIENLQQVPKELLNFDPRSKMIAIHRTTLGYFWATECSKSPSKFIHDTMHYINSALIELQDKLGDLSKYELVCNRPGQSLEYFREVEGAAGYEFRIVVMRKE